MSKPTSADKRIFAAAESLSDEIFRHARTLIQPEDLVTWITVHIELRPEEQEEEAERIERELKEVKQVQQRQSIAGELRELLGRPNLSLFECIHEAVYEIKRLRKKSMNVNKQETVMITTAAFDCFGTIFDMSNFPKSDIADYVAHVKRNDFTEYAFNGPWWELKAFPDVKEGLELFDSIGIRCYAFSNGRKRLLETLFEDNNLTFTDIWDPTEHNVYKPHPSAYPTFCDWIGVKPWNCLMVTANPTFGDVEGASVIGMKPWVIRHGRPRDVLALAEHFAMLKKLEYAIDSMKNGGAQP